VTEAADAFLVLREHGSPRDDDPAVQTDRGIEPVAHTTPDQRQAEPAQLQSGSIPGESAAVSGTSISTTNTPNVVKRPCAYRRGSIPGLVVSTGQMGFLEV